MNVKPYRPMYRFWLDFTKPSEKAIADKIENLKNSRSFTSVIRDGIRLICDLRDGKLDILFELFPWVRAEFLEYMRDTTQIVSLAPPTMIQQSPTDEKLQVQLKRIEALLVQQQGKQAISGELQTVMRDPKQLGAPQFAAPSFDEEDDDLLSVKKDTSSDKRSTQNFIKSLMSLQQ
jgi:hypothetical protein